jgi:mycothiol synthase
MNAHLASSEYHTELDTQAMRNLIRSLPGETSVIDFEETILLQSVRSATRLWWTGSKLVGFAWVDDYNNLRFEIDAEHRSEQLEQEIIEWGAACVKKRSAITGQDDTLDASFSPEHTWQIALLERSGFVRDDVRTFQYERSMDQPIVDQPLPVGYITRPVAGEQEAADLVCLHRAAFGTDKMTVEARLAIMRAPQYERALDFVIVAPSGELAAFCICGVDEVHERSGYTDPIGTHPDYRGLGLGKAVVTTGLLALKDKGVQVVKLGTSSENLAMQRLADTLGFVLVSEKWWYCKNVS